MFRESYKEIEDRTREEIRRLIPDIEAQQEVIAEEIEKAFGDVEYPGDDHLVHLPTCTHPDCRDAVRGLRGCHWRDLARQTLLYRSSWLTVLSAEARRFFLPAFLLASLPVEEVAAYGLACDVMFVVCTCMNSTEISGYTPAQCAVVQRFLEYNSRIGSVVYVDNTLEMIERGMGLWS